VGSRNTKLRAVINSSRRRLYIRCFHYFPPECGCHEKQIFFREWATIITCIICNYIHDIYLEYYQLFSYIIISARLSSANLYHFLIAAVHCANHSLKQTMYFNNSNHLLTVNIIELSANFITKIFCLDFLALASILNEYYWNPLISRLFPIGMYSSSVRVSFGAFFFSKFILLLFATLLLPLGAYCYSVAIPFYPAERENLGKAPLNVFHRGSRSQIGGIRRCSRDTPCCLGTLRYLNCRSICARAHEHTYVHGNTRIQPLTHRRLYRNRFQSSVVRQIVIKKDQRASQKSQPCCNRHYSFPI